MLDKPGASTEFAIFWHSSGFNSLQSEMPFQWMSHTVENITLYQFGNYGAFRVTECH